MHVVSHMTPDRDGAAVAARGQSPVVSAMHRATTGEPVVVRDWSSAMSISTPPPPKTRSSNEVQTAPDAPARPAKKQRLLTDERWVVLVPFDEPFKPVLADRSLLEHYECRSAALLKHQPPDCEIEGRPAWNFYMSRSLLVAFLKSLTHGEFLYPKDTDAHEVTRTFEYEGIPMPGNCIQSLATQSLSQKAPTLGQRMRNEARGSRLSIYVSQVVHGLLDWPRLQAGLELAERGADPGFSASGTRVWIAFSPPPQLVRYPGADDIYQMAKKRQTWLNKNLQAVGVVHYRMVKAGLLDKEARDEQSFVTLVRHGVEIEPTHYYLSCKRDMPRNLRSENREALRHSDQFATSICNTVADHGEDRGQSMAERVEYARACIKLVAEMTEQAPNLSRLFGGQCSDPPRVSPAGSKAPVDTTPERHALANALRVHGIKVLAWSDERTPGVAPLVFPPAYLSATVAASPYVLLDCESRAAARDTSKE